MKRLALFAVLSLVPFIQGCDLEKDAVPQVQQYFPNAVKLSFDKRVFWIQTNVSGVSPKFAGEAFEKFAMQANQTAAEYFLSLNSVLSLSGHGLLVMGFDSGVVMYFPNLSRYYTMSYPVADAWSQKNFGYKFTDAMRQAGVEPPQ